MPKHSAANIPAKKKMMPAPMKWLVGILISSCFIGQILRRKVWRFTSVFTLPMRDAVGMVIDRVDMGLITGFPSNKAGIV